ncbi:hypothetical protein Bhyg_07052 [Pseudolycoriella hygida]|uniref:Uncharacterized protein n=1 Tax=Pseudolycoriella hygida TaxID=35572 RepID=A0A9Q0N2E0_9DIPT|nr:hypothetical protein Bhyg_07052 [Pseudolycoriella hygida]
MKTVWRYCFSR